MGTLKTFWAILRGAVLGIAEHLRELRDDAAAGSKPASMMLLALLAVVVALSAVVHTAIKDTSSLDQEYAACVRAGGQRSISERFGKSCTWR